jgi:hypothetical protein
MVAPMGRMLDAGVAVGFGVIDQMVTTKAVKKGPGNIPWGAYLEGGAVALGFFGQHVGVPADARDPLLLLGLGFAAARGTRAAMAGNLGKLSAWGGDSGTGGDGDGSVMQQVASGGRGPAKQLGRGGGFGANTGIYQGPLQEAAGTAG